PKQWRRRASWPRHTPNPSPLPKLEQRRRSTMWPPPALKPKQWRRRAPKPSPLPKPEQVRRSTVWPPTALKPKQWRRRAKAKAKAVEVEQAMDAASVEAKATEEERCSPHPTEANVAEEERNVPFAHAKVKPTPSRTTPPPLPQRRPMSKESRLR
uniref:Uncharacterized protein n=1 Tax=Aegilops tauschii subsp. strangulata TaxID=200361 RepID=A0A452ZT00_AEGTS